MAGSSLSLAARTINIRVLGTDFKLTAMQRNECSKSLMLKEVVGKRATVTVGSSLAIGMAGASHGHLEVGGRLVLQLVGQRVDLEPIQSENNTPVSSTFQLLSGGV